MGKKEIFILRAKDIHGHQYSYELVDYEGIKKKVKITCPEHGVFEQTPHHHVTRKQGCGKCRYLKISKKTRSTKEGFIEKAMRTHGDKYDYSLVDYVNRKTKVKILCKIHGVFEQEPHNHINGQDCGKCSGLYKTDESLIKEAMGVHGDKYGYSLMNYISHDKKIRIICPKHGVFEQLVCAHIGLGQGCPKCVGLNKTTKEFIIEAGERHGNEYDYSLVEYVGSKNKVMINCLKHGLFKQTPNDHLRGKGCPICRESVGEKEIRVLLNEKNISFIQEHTFNDCRNTCQLPFDFYLPDHNTCVEYDGVQHYRPVDFFGGKEAFLKTKINDSIKTKYCFDNKINLIRIAFNKRCYKSLNNLLVI